MPRIGRMPFAGLGMSAMMGVLLAEYACPHPLAVASSAGLCLLLASLNGRSWLVYVCVVAVFASIHTMHWHHHPSRAFAADLIARRGLTRLYGQVASPPTQSPGGQTTFNLRVTTLDGVPVHGRHILRVRGFIPPPDFGSTVEIRGIASAIDRARNPGEFDFANHLARRSIFAEVKVLSERDVIPIHAAPVGVMAIITAMRLASERLLAVDLEDAPVVAATIKAMILGRTDNVPDDQLQSFRDSGTLHLFSVSGLHVGMFACLIHSFVGMSRLSRVAGLGLSLATVAFYVLLTGASSASVRAGVMSAVVLLGSAHGRRSIGLNSLFAAGVVLLAINTNQLFDAGFQLSFGAVLGILSIYRPVTTLIKPLIAADPFVPAALIAPVEKCLRRATQRIIELAVVSTAAAVGTSLLMWFHFHTITPLATAANVVVVPLAFAVLALGIASLVTGPFGELLPALWNNANWLVTSIVLAIVHFFASLPGATLHVATHPFIRDGRIAELLVLDTRRGQSILVRDARSTALINAGSQRDYGFITSKVLAAHGINTLNSLVLTQGDASHLGAARDVILEHAPQSVFASALPDRSASRRALEEAFATRIQKVVAGDTFHLTEHVRAVVVHPSPAFNHRNAADRSMVLDLQCCNSRVLLMSGASFTTESALIESGLDLTSDIIIYGRPSEGAIHRSDIVARARPSILVGMRSATTAPVEPPTRTLSLEHTGALRIIIHNDHIAIESMLLEGSFFVPGRRAATIYSE